jgi:hypothetical protein
VAGSGVGLARRGKGRSRKHFDFGISSTLINFLTQKEYKNIDVIHYDSALQI